MNASISVKEVKKSFGEKQVLRNITLEVKKGEILGLIGQSGCGKTTLLKILVGYYTADSGTVSINGKKWGVLEQRRMVGYTSQENSFYEKLTIAENMRYYAKLYNVNYKEQEEIISNLLTQVGLLTHQQALTEKISGGMKRRLDFAISLLHNPPILILDEPTTGLDPLLIDQFWNIVTEVVRRDEKIVIMSSHIISEIEKFCNKVAIMENGVIIKTLEKDEMKGLEKKFRSIIKQ